MLDFPLRSLCCTFLCALCGFVLIFNRKERKVFRKANKVNTLLYFLS